MFGGAGNAAGAVGDGVFGETEQAEAMRELREMMPTFSQESSYTYIYMHVHAHACTYMHVHAHTCMYMHVHAHTYTSQESFLQEIGEEMGPRVIGAYLKGDMDVLRATCRDQAYATLNASVVDRHTRQLLMDTRILHMSEPELEGIRIIAGWAQPSHLSHLSHLTPPTLHTSHTSHTSPTSPSSHLTHLTHLTPHTTGTYLDDRYRPCASVVRIAKVYIHSAIYTSKSIFSKSIFSPPRHPTAHKAPPFYIEVISLTPPLHRA